MEGSRPNPDETETFSSTKSAKAEGVAAWLGRQRDDERHIILSDTLDSTGDDKEKDEKSKKAKRLRLGALPVEVDDKLVAEKPASDATHEAAESDTPHPEENTSESPALEAPESDAANKVPVYEAAAEVVSAAELEYQQDAQEHALRQEQEDFRAWEEELQTAHAEAEDFKQWEQQFQTTEAQSSADMQMSETEPDEEPDLPLPAKPRSSYAHNRRPAPSSRPHSNAASSRYGQPFVIPPAPVPAGGAGGGGNIVPPVPGGLGNPNNPNNPFGPFEAPDGGSVPSANVIPLPADPNILGGISPNTLKTHEHHHGHPRLALAMAAGLLVEHMLGKRADKRIDTEMRQRTDKLREQIERTQTTQAEAQRKLESQQMSVVAEQDRQRRIIEQQNEAIISPTPAAAERLAAAPTVVAAEVAPQQRTAARAEQSKAAPEATAPSVEEVSIVGTDAYAEAQARPAAVMEQVAVAAEQDMPVERVYERRQEVRDEPSSPAGAAAGGAAGIFGSTPSGQQVGTTSGGGADSSQATNDHQGIQAPESDYRAAVARGIGAALALITLALLAYLLF